MTYGTLGLFSDGTCFPARMLERGMNVEFHSEVSAMHHIADFTII